MTAPIVRLVPVLLQDQLVRIDVMVEHFPSNFFGVGFDFTLDGGPWAFQKYEVGSIFQSPRDVLVLVTERDETVKKMVFGLSFKGNRYYALRDGKIISFYLKLPVETSATSQQVLSAHITQGVFSTFDGTRKDVANVVWQDGVLNGISKHVSGQTQAVSEHNSQEDAALDDSATDIFQAGSSMEPSQGQALFQVSDDTFPQIYLVMLVFFVVLTVAGVVFWLISQLKGRSGEP